MAAIAGRAAEDLGKVGTGTLTFRARTPTPAPRSVTEGRLRVNEATGQGLSNSWTYVGPGATLEYTESGRGGSHSVINTASSSANGYGGKISFHDTASAGSLSILPKRNHVFVGVHRGRNLLSTTTRLRVMRPSPTRADRRVATRMAARCFSSEMRAREMRPSRIKVAAWRERAAAS